MTTIKQILLDDEVSAKEVQRLETSLDLVVAKIEKYARVPEAEVFAKDLLASAWDLQSKLYALRGPNA